MLQSVLLIEGDQARRARCREALDAQGYLAIAVRDGAEALELLAVVVPGAIAVGHDAPAVDGRTLLVGLGDLAALQGVPCLLFGAAGRDAAGIDPGLDVWPLPVALDAGPLLGALHRALPPRQAQRRAAAA